MDAKPEKIVLYDGVCNLCDGVIHFVLPRDSRGSLRFASLQGAYARDLLMRHGITLSDPPESLVFVEFGKIYMGSEGALRIARNLDWPWRALGIFLGVPRPLRDAVYRWVARHRYRWFGRNPTCLLPRPEWKHRFLESAEELTRVP